MWPRNLSAAAQSCAPKLRAVSPLECLEPLPFFTDSQLGAARRDTNGFSSIHPRVLEHRDEKIGGQSQGDRKCTRHPNTTFVGEHLPDGPKADHQHFFIPIFLPSSFCHDPCIPRPAFHRGCIAFSPLKPV